MLFHHPIYIMNKKITLIFIVFSSIVVLFSCKKKKEENSFEHNQEVQFTTGSSENYFVLTRELKNEIITKGSEKAYHDLFEEYMAHDQMQDMLPYSLLMANKYNYTSAYLDVFYCLTHFSGKNTDSLDIKTRNLALSYLMQSYVLGDENAKLIISTYIKDAKYSLNDTLLYRKEIAMHAY